VAAGRLVLVLLRLKMGDPPYLFPLISVLILKVLPAASRPLDSGKPAYPFPDLTPWPPVATFSLFPTAARRTSGK